MAEPLPSIVVGGEGARLVKEKGVLMVYSKWVVEKPRGLEPGSLVVVEDEEGELLGCGLYDTAGPVALRLLEAGGCSFSSVEEALRDRLEKALEARRRLGLVRPGAGYRLVHSDGDMLPGLVVDVYGGLVVYQSSSLVWDIHGDLVARTLAEVTGARMVYEKSTQRSRRDIGLEPRESPRLGEPRPVVVEEDGVRFLVDPRRGQKTGLFLDQRLNRIDFGGLAEGRVLDLFAYTGGFGLHALVRGGAEEAVFVEEDHNAVEMLRENLRLNRVEDRARIVEGNAWGFLRRSLPRGRRYDAVAVDPPAFIPHQAAYEKGRRAYRSLYSQAARLVSRGGLLLLSSCSTHLDRDEFRQVVAEALAAAGRSYTPLGGVRGMPPDHPVRPGAPHLEYLKAQMLLLW